MSRFDPVRLLNEGNLYAYSIPERRTTPLTQGPGLRAPGECSPDGKSAVYWDDQAIWQVAFDEPQPRKIADASGGQSYVRFSPDGKWLYFHSGSQLSFVRIADTNRVEIKLPETVGSSFAVSSDRKKLLFYKSSYEWKEFWRFISASGGKSFGPAPEYQLSPWSAPCWSPDSRFVVLWSEREDQRGYWVVPLSGDTPFPLRLDVALEGKLAHEAMSFRGQSLLFSAVPPQKPKSYWAVPVSVREGKSVGTPVKVCEQAGAQGFRWSPDGKKLAWQQKDAIWTARSDGSGGKQLPADSKRKVWLDWVPDSNGLGWISYLSMSPPRSALYLANLSANEPRTLVDNTAALGMLWSPDSQRVAYWTYGSDAEPDALFVLDVEKKDLRKFLEQPHKRYASRRLAWSPDGHELAAAAERELLAFQLPDLKRRVLADLEPLHWTRCVDLKWSPTGSHLAFVLWPMPGEKATDPESARLFTVSAQAGAVTDIAANEKGYRNFLHWSPDGKRILYDSESYIRIRPAGEIWEADVDALLRQAQLKK